MMKKKIFLLMFLFLSPFILLGCNENQNNSGGSQNNDNKIEHIDLTKDVTIWNVLGTQKVMADRTDLYENLKKEAKLNVMLGLGEYEGTQLIISPKKNISSVELITSDLTLQNGNATFSKENIEVFFEKYVYVGRNYENNGAPIGWYPDALVPMEKIIEFKENKIDANTNQGLYIRFKTDFNTAAGIYTGNFTLKINDQEMNIPVSVEVFNVKISETAHCKTYFISDWQYRLGELDSTQAMLEKYIEAGLEYRISPASVRIEKSTTEEGINEYIETAIKFMKNPKCTNIAIMWESATVDGVSAFNKDTFELILDKFIEKSIEDNFDYVAKLGTHLVDEPNLNSTFEMLKKKTTFFKEVVAKVANKLEARTDIGSKELQDQLVESVLTIPAVITCPYTDDYAQYASYIDYWCPTVDYYDNPDSRARYDSQEEKWWYTCISPRAPYPTYHTEDTLLSARLLSWMQAEYDVVGNLFWATNVYACYDGTKYVNIEDFYSGDASRFSQVNGDGYLFYPGKPYGIDGPIGSLRLEAIRDGEEEYELFYSIKEKYAEISENIGIDFDEKKVISDLVNSLYSGTKVTATDEGFDTARRNLYNVAYMSESDSNFAIIDCGDKGYGNIEYTLFVKNGYDVYQSSELINQKQSVSGGNIYNIKADLSNDSNSLDITVKNDTNEYQYSKYLGGKVVINYAEDLKDCFAKHNASVTVSVVDESTISSSETGDILKLEIGSTTTKTQGIKVNNLFNNLDNNTKKVVFYIYNDSDTPIDFAFTVKYSNSSYQMDLYATKLNYGMNEIIVSFENVNFNNLGNIEDGYFYFGTTKNEAAKTIYVKAVSIYSK